MPHQEHHQTKAKKSKRRKIDMNDHPGRIITVHLKKVGTSTKGKLVNVLKENSPSECETTLNAIAMMQFQSCMNLAWFLTVAGPGKSSGSVTQ